MSKLLTNRTDNDIKNKWYSMKRKEERQGLHEPSIYPKNLANRATTSDDQEVADVPEHIAQVSSSCEVGASQFRLMMKCSVETNTLLSLVCLRIAQRAAALSQIGVVGNPEPTAPPALAAAAAATAASAPAPAEVAAPAATETESEEFSPRNWSADADKAEV